MLYIASGLISEYIERQIVLAWIHLWVVTDLCHTLDLIVGLLFICCMPMLLLLIKPNLPLTIGEDIVWNFKKFQQVSMLL
jgi:hypothetical protein